MCGMQDLFARGLALYSIARRSKKGKYKSAADRIRKIFAKWVKKGNPNVQHQYLMLNAEASALKKLQGTQGTYQEAIIIAGRSGHIYHSALCNERYADYCMFGTSKNGSAEAREEACFRRDEALRLYGEWGASAKVQMLKSKIEKR